MRRYAENVGVLQGVMQFKISAFRRWRSVIVIYIWNWPPAIVLLRGVEQTAMCGICGIFEHERLTDISSSLVHKMNQTMSHRAQTTEESSWVLVLAWATGGLALSTWSVAISRCRTKTKRFGFYSTARFTTTLNYEPSC